MKTCFLFPGQGAQYPGMGKDFYEASPAVRELFEEASDTVNIDLKKLIFEGNEDELKITNNTQMAVGLADLAAFTAAGEMGIPPDGAAGFSLGEWPALAAAGVLSRKDMFRLIKIRGELMETAGRKAGLSGMSAILFLNPSKVDEVLASSGIKDVYAANYNSPVQVVISGTEIGIAQAEEALKAAGAKKVVRLRVSGPFHTPLMQYARDGLREALQDVEFSNPKIPLYSNVNGSRVGNGAEARRLAVEQVVSPVRWTDEEEAIKAEGFDLCIESGPGTVLCGLWRAVDTKIPCLPSGNLDQLSAIRPREG